MEHENSFYITLSSNSSKDFYGENRADNFKVHLGRQLHLDWSYEVALTQIHYPMTVFNINGSNRRIWYQSSARKGVVFVQESYYKTREDVFLAVDKILPKKLEEDGFIVLSENLAHVLGFRTRRLTMDSYKLQQNLHSTCIDAGLPQSLYVHCNIIAKQYVGEEVKDLLRIVPMRSYDYKFGCEDCLNFVKPHYIPVEKHKIDTIEINIKDGKGENILFQYGTSTVVLHFRRRKDV